MQAQLDWYEYSLNKSKKIEAEKDSLLLYKDNLLKLSESNNKVNQDILKDTRSELKRAKRKGKVLVITSGALTLLALFLAVK